MDLGDDISEEPTPTDRVRNIVREHLRGEVGFHVLEIVTQAAMEALREAKPIIRDIIDEERALPCDVKLPPSTIIRKGCTFYTLAIAIAQREKHKDQLTPEQLSL